MFLNDLRRGGSVTIVTYTLIAFTSNSQGKEYVHGLQEKRRDVAAGHLAYSLGCGSTCPGCVFQRPGNDLGDPRRPRWNIHLDASIDQRRS